MSIGSIFMLGNNEEAASYPDERFYAKLFYVLCTRPLHRLGFVSVGEKTALLQDADLRERE